MKSMALDLERGNRLSCPGSAARSSNSAASSAWRPMRGMMYAVLKPYIMGTQGDDAQAARRR
jgi:hypothetical protein